jgi:hypothetical protein
MTTLFPSLEGIRAVLLLLVIGPCPNFFFFLDIESFV